jgi:hypothetical protein
MTIALDDDASVTLDADGYGRASLGPRSLSQIWTVTNIAVSVSSATNEPTCNVYLNAVGQPYVLFGTYSGSRDDTACNVILRSGNKLITVWENGDPGALATISIYGTFRKGR